MIITQTIKNIWPTVQDFINDIVIPFSQYYWSDIQSLLTSENIYDYLCATYNNRYIMYDKNNFINKFKLIYHDNLMSLYKNIDILIDNIWEQFRKNDNLGQVSKKIDNSVINKKSNSTNKNNYNNGNLASNQSTESTFNKINNADAVGMRTENKGNSTNSLTVNASDEIFDTLRTNQAHYYDEYTKILHNAITIGINAFIWKFNGLFNAFYIANCWQNKNNLI